MATHSSILAWEISWTEEPGGWWATVHTNIHSSIIHNSQEQETTQMSIISSCGMFTSIQWKIIQLLLPAQYGRILQC